MGEPRAAPPLIPAGYGVSADASGAELLPWSWAAECLAGARNYWLCTARVDGRPHAMPVWAVWLEDDGQEREAVEEWRKLFNWRMPRP